MKICNIYFSPTGGTKSVADAIASRLGEDIIDIDLCVRNISKVSPDADLAIISAPVYNGRISDAIRERISAVTSNGTPCVVVAVFGNRAYENALAELSDAVTKSGYKVIAAIAAVAEHSIMRQFGTGRPDAADIATIKQYADAINAKLEVGVLSMPKVPGVVSLKPTKDGQLVPKPGRRCDACCLCAIRCSMGAIDLNNPKKVDKAKCISCMRCVAVCPKQVRKASPIVVKLISMLMKKAFVAPKAYELYL